jgi:hypothetical protein
MVKVQSDNNVKSKVEATTVVISCVVFHVTPNKISSRMQHIEEIHPAIN